MERQEKALKIVRRYSEALKLKVVQEVEIGEASVRQAGRDYGIPATTIDAWMKRYGVSTKKTKIVRVVLKNEKQRIKELEKALSDSVLKNRIYEKMLEFAKKEDGYEVKKNSSTGELRLVKMKEVAK